MKIAVTSSGPTLDSELDPRFGRAQYILIVDTDGLDVEAIENPSISAGGGAGVQTSQMVADRGAEAVLTGNCGPNAFRTLSAAGIQVYTSLSGTVRSVIQTFTEGKLTPISDPSVPSHFGVSGSQS